MQLTIKKKYVYMIKESLNEFSKDKKHDIVRANQPTTGKLINNMFTLLLPWTKFPVIGDVMESALVYGGISYLPDLFVFYSLDSNPADNQQVATGYTQPRLLQEQ